MADQKKILLITAEPFFATYVINALQKHFHTLPEVITPQQVRDYTPDQLKSFDAIILTHPHQVPRIFQEEGLDGADAAIHLLKSLRVKAGSGLPIFCAESSKDDPVREILKQKLNSQDIVFIDNAPKTVTENILQAIIRVQRR